MDTFIWEEWMQLVFTDEYYEVGKLGKTHFTSGHSLGFIWYIGERKMDKKIQRLPEGDGRYKPDKKAVQWPNEKKGEDGVAARL